MKLNLRLTSFLLALIMTLGMLVSCLPEDAGYDPSASNQIVQISESTQPTEPSPQNFDLIVNGETTVKIIRPQDLASDHAYVTAAINVRDQIAALTNVRLTMGDDFKRATEEYDASTLEILIGNTRHPQVAEAISGLKYSEYTVKAVGNKIIIFGYTDLALSNAVKEFIQIVTENVTQKDGAVTVSIPTEELNVVELHSGSKELGAVPAFEESSFIATSSSDKSCDQLILGDVTLDEYNAYVSELEASGYKKYTGSDLSGNIFNTLYNSDYTVNVGYYKPYGECRIIIEPYSDKTLIGLESDNNRPTVTTTQITMLGCEFKESGGAYKGNGLSLLYRLSDGSFVIVDGGHDTNSSYWATNLINAITEQAKGYASGKNIRIAAWFISHAHGDHMGMLKKEASTFASKFTVERVITCLMSDAEINKSLGSSHGANFGGGEAKTAASVRTAANALKADLITCHTGQRFFFGDTVFEILYTVENFAPSITNALNTSSILVRSITTDKSGKSTSVMVMGDITGPAMEICTKLYGNDLKCDVVQVAHHGYQTWGNDKAIANSYNIMAPEIVIWPMGLHAYSTHKEKSYNKVLWDGSNKNLKQVYVAGWNGTTHTIPLPFNGDISTITSKITSEK